MKGPTISQGWGGIGALAPAAPALDGGPAVPAHPPLLVLGMHRSGTSFLAGSLQAAGLALDGASTQDKHNAKGNRERRDLMELHDRILAARGHAWHDPPPGPVGWTPEESGEARALTAAAAAAGGPWGFKDPRALLLAEGWLALFPEARIVGIFRHPAAVAASLQARFGFPAERSHGLWAAYNRRLLRLHEGRGFPLLAFDEPEEALRARLDAALPALGLRPPEEPFFDGTLRHHAAARQVPADLRPLWDALEARRS